MASNVVSFNARNTKQPSQGKSTNNCGAVHNAHGAHGAVIASFGQARALRDLPRHLKAGAL